jgi:beta-glucosidase
LPDLTETDLAETVGRLTIGEKAALCSGADMWHTVAIPRLGIGSIMVADGPHGLRVQPNAADHSSARTSLPATCFPTAAALASTWNTALIDRVGIAIASEARAQGITVVLGPGVNIKRSLLCGRNFEYFSEDPYLAGTAATAFVNGVQSQGIGTSLKHFAVNNQETDRMRVSAEVHERALREIYLAAFEQCVKQAAPWTVMCAYNRVNGTYASEHHWLLTGVLRDEWGFGGLVVSDWGAVHDRVAALAAGLDLEMPPDLERSPAAVVAAVEAGRLDEAVLDRAVGRVLELVGRADAPGRREPREPQEQPEPCDFAAHHELARQAAAEGAVLLKNSSVLPLAPASGATVAVIGEFARKPRYQGAGSSRVNPVRVENFLDEFTARVGDQVTVRFAPGFELAGDEVDEDAADQAMSAAAGADYIILLLGLPGRAESEGYDRDHIDLPRNQISLLRLLRTAGPPVIVVLSNGGVVDVASWDADADAILECWLGGQAGAGAAAQLLLGQAEPAGRLAETIPRRLADSPAFLNFPGEDGEVHYGEGIFVGYRYYDARSIEVAYPFGFGLSYTTFGYGELTVRSSGSADAGDLEVRVGCRVTNTGQRSGSEVVQLYVGQQDPAIERPVRELRGFAKVDLAPGAAEMVWFTLGRRDFACWSTARSGWTVPPGRYEVAVGSSSRDLKLTATIEIDGSTGARRPLDGRSTLEEWLADPDGRSALMRAAGSGSDGRPNGILADANRMRVSGNIPLRQFAVFPGTGITYELLDAVRAELGPPK